MCCMGMGAHRLIGLLAAIPMTMLLTVSFFVLFAVRKQESQGLKAFGYFVTVLLWCSALLVLSCSIYVLSTGRSPINCRMGKSMCARMPASMGSLEQNMMSARMPGMMSPMQKMMRGKEEMMEKQGQDIPSQKK